VAANLLTNLTKKALFK